MATLAQLQAEPLWGREITTSPMVGLGLQLRTAYGTGALSVGIKGNERHLSGGHRSQEWIKGSAYCTNRNYATQSGLLGDQPRYCAALDFTPGAWGSADNRAKMRVLTGRMITAMKAGLCDEVLEVFGTLDGQTVTGWRNDLNVVVSADSSHLDHIHIRFDRRYCNDNTVMANVAAILLGDDDVSKAEVLDALDDAVPYTSEGVAKWAAAHGWAPAISTRVLAEMAWQQTYYNVPQIAKDVAELRARPPVQIDPAQLQTAIEAAVGALVDQIAAGVAAKLGLLEAAADRARADVLDG